MNDSDKAIEDKLQAIRDSFNLNKCQYLNEVTRELLTQAIDAKIKELVLSHDFRGRFKRKENKGNKEVVEGNIQAYHELRKQIEALSKSSIDNTQVGE